MMRVRAGVGQVAGLMQRLCLVAGLGLVPVGIPAVAQETQSPVTQAPQQDAQAPAAAPDAAPAGTTGSPAAAQPDPAAAAAGATAPAQPAAPGLSKSQTAGQVSGTKSIAATQLPGQEAIDYAAWEPLAARAERSIADGQTSDSGLGLLRGQLVDWRTRFQTAQSSNDTRLQSLRDQITALGPAPADGATEAAEIAGRRTTLNEQLQAYEAPRRAAEEAYRRASGLISEIDRALRERQAKQLLKLWPSPVNPENWAKAGGVLRDTATAFWTELRGNWDRGERRAAMIDAAPVSALFLALALFLIFRGRDLIERASAWVTTSSRSARWRRVFGFMASLGQIVVPVAGVWLIAKAIGMTTIPGFRTQQLLNVLPGAGFVLFFTLWLAGRVFPRAAGGDTVGLLVGPAVPGGPLGLSPQMAAEARFDLGLIGVLQALELLRRTLMPPAQVPETAVPVLALPLVLAMSLLLWRIGRMLNRNQVDAGQAVTEPGDEDGSFRGFAIRLVGKLLLAIALLGPLLAVVGYTTAASALIFPAAASLSLAGLLLVLVQLIADLWRAVTGVSDDAADGGLLPVLAGFAITLASLPLFALLWGARVQDLGEMWNRFSEGYAFGDTRISPSTFVYLLVLFCIGYALTRLFQGALRSSILPKTRLDQGGRNAVVSGVGYIGIFVSALVAVSSAGLDLSNLAIFASALSVGIGFGLQNIVQNFVSGIILLIERPVSEGDWIEVGGVSGTVRSISVRSTRIQTFDRSDVIVPNGNLVSQQVTNWTRFSLTGRVIVPVSVKFGNDTRQVSQILRDIAEAQPMALLNPPPAVLFTGIAADQLNFEIRVLIRDVNAGSSVRSDIYHQVIERFAGAGISLAGTPAAAAPSRIEDVATVLEVLNAATPDQLALIAPNRMLSPDPAGAGGGALADAPDAPATDGDHLNTETDR